MSDIVNQVLRVLTNFKFEDCPIAASEFAKVEASEQGINIELSLGYPCLNVQSDMTEQLTSHIKEVLGDVGCLAIRFTQEVPVAPALNAQGSVAGVKNIIAVASGKGGVGKSTTSVNIALALAHEGAKVGLLDADIYGPSQAHMLGFGDQRPIMASGKFLIPLEAYGIKCISMGSLVNENTPMIWRGPMVSGALQQLLNNTQWQELDYLIIDMPPGTGDIQLTLAQSVPVTGSLIVTTPQDIALLDAKKGIEMFAKVNIPVFGVVENMSTHICSNCGHQEAIFGEHGAEKLAKDFSVDTLGQLPLKMEIREQTDSGKPPVAQDPDSIVSLEYRKIARQLAARVWRQALEGSAGPEISFSDD